MDTTQFQTTTSARSVDAELTSEITKFKESADAFKAGADFLALIDAGKPASYDTYTAPLDGMAEAIKPVVDLSKQMTDFLKNILDESKAKTYTNLMVWSVILIVGGFSMFIATMVVLSNFFNKCLCLGQKCGKILLIIEMFCTLIVSLLGVVMVIFAIILTNLCAVVGLSFGPEGEEFIKDMSPELHKFMQPCIFENGTGYLGDTLDPSSKSVLDTLNTLPKMFKSSTDNAGILDNLSPTNLQVFNLMKDYTGYTTSQEFSSFTGSQNFFTRATELTAELAICTDNFRDKIVPLPADCNATPQGWGVNNGCVVFSVLAGESEANIDARYGANGCPA